VKSTFAGPESSYESSSRGQGSYLYPTLSTSFMASELKILTGHARKPRAFEALGN